MMVCEHNEFMVSETCGTGEGGLIDCYPVLFIMTVMYSIDITNYIDIASKSATATKPKVPPSLKYTNNLHINTV